MSHAKFSPSSAHRWLRCTGSIEKCKDAPSTSSWYADEGTAAHELGAWCLESGNDAEHYLGKEIHVRDEEGEIRNSFIVDDDMAGYVQVYVDSVRDAAEGADLLMVEQRVDFSDYIGVEGQTGTADALILKSAEQLLDVHDLKYGQGEKVFAKENEQEMLYALGGLYEFCLLYEINTVRLNIHQPRLDHMDSWEISVSALENFAKMAKKKAHEGLLPDAPLTPGETQCRWCPAKATCEAAAEAVHNAVADDFGNLDLPDATTEPSTLEDNYKMVGFVRDWANAVEKEMLDRLHSEPGTIQGFKLAHGKAGNRVWQDEDRVVDLFKRFRLRKEEMFTMKPLSPAQAEKRFKKQPKRWSKLEELITRGKPSIKIVPADDPRPGITTDEDFSDLTGGSENGE